MTDDALVRAIVGALRSQIRDHGPITAERIGSAAKRILGNLVNVASSGLAAGLARRRWAGVTDKQRSRHQAAAARAGWAGMTKAERSAEMKRRASKRKRRSGLGG